MIKEKIDSTHEELLLSGLYFSIGGLVKATGFKAKTIQQYMYNSKNFPQPALKVIKTKTLLWNKKAVQEWWDNYRSLKND